MLIAPGALIAARPTGHDFLTYLLSLDQADMAAEELTRLEQLEPERSGNPRLMTRVANALWTAGRFTAALQLYEQALQLSDPSTEQDQLRLELAWRYLVQQRPEPALVELARIDAFGISETVKRQASEMTCLASIIQQDPGQVQRCWEETGLWNRWDAQTQEQAGDMLKRLEPGPKWPAFVRAGASALLPGLGQLTAGDPRDGGNALLVNGAWIAGSLLLASNGLMLEAVMVMAGFGTRFYLTNVRHGFAASEARDARARRKAMLQMLELSASPASIDTADPL